MSKFISQVRKDFKGLFSGLKDIYLNRFSNRNRYKTHSEAVIIACFYNPQNSPYRLLAFQKWYRSVKHLNYRIIECLIGPEAVSQLPEDPNIIQVETDSFLWHKETLLNRLVAELPDKFKYVFWVDADVLFTSNDWLVDSVKQLQSGADIVQPFEYCVHLEQNQLVPGFDVELAKKTACMTNKELMQKKRLWRSFCANVVDNKRLGKDADYDRHGHVGFAWGAKRSVLEACPLFDRALIGGADHVIAHAAAGHIPHPCIVKGFADNIDEVLLWSNEFFKAVRGRIGYAKGDLYHIWHGDIEARQYLKRIKDFTDQTTKITDRDKNGLHISTDGRDRYVRRYYQDREVAFSEDYDFQGFDSGFYEDMGYTIMDIANIFGEPQYYDVQEDDAGVPDFQPIEQVSLEQGGAGIPDNGQHVITDEMLEGTMISGSYRFNEDVDIQADDLETAIYHASQPEFVPADSLDPNDANSGNFS